MRVSVGEPKGAVFDAKKMGATAPIFIIGNYKCAGSEAGAVLYIPAYLIPKYMMYK